MAMFRTNSGVLLQHNAGNYASNNVPNSYATELKVGYAARLFYGDAFIANQKSTGGVDILARFRRLFPNHKGELYKVGLNLHQFTKFRSFCRA
jgi:hypothetical protein